MVLQCICDRGFSCLSAEEWNRGENPKVTLIVFQVFPPALPSSQQAGWEVPVLFCPCLAFLCLCPMLIFLSELWVRWDVTQRKALSPGLSKID